MYYNKREPTLQASSKFGINIRVVRGKNEKICLHARIKQTNVSNTETTLSSVDTRGSLPIFNLYTIKCWPFVTFPGDSAGKAIVYNWPRSVMRSCQGWRWFCLLFCKLPLVYIVVYVMGPTILRVFFAIFPKHSTYL